MMPPTVGGSVRQAATWSILSFAVAQAVRLGGNLLLTKLVSPEYFGLMAVVYVLMNGLTLFSDVGLTQSVVRSARVHEPPFLNTAWTLQFLRGFGLWIVALLIALALATVQSYGLMPAGSAYANAQLPWVIGVYAVLAVISGADSIKLALARRNLNLKRLAIVEIAGQILSLMVMLLWALLSPSVWALVAGGLSGALARMVLSHGVVPGPQVRFQLDMSVAGDILSFGKWIFVSSVIGFFWINGDRLYLGAALDERTLGIYSLAYMLSAAIQMAFLQIVFNVALPALSRVVRDDEAALGSAYYKLRSRLDLLVLVVAGLLYVLAPTIVHLLYDNRYHEAGHMLRLLSLGLVVLRWQLADQCFIALGHPRISTTLNVIRLAALLISMPVGFSLGGIDGALLAIALHPLASLPYLFRQQAAYGFLNLKFELFVLPAYFVGVVAGGLVLMVIP